MSSGRRHPLSSLLGNEWLVFAVALILHVSLVFAIGHYKKPRLWENGAMATTIFEGKGLRCALSGPEDYSSWQAPGYPYMLAGMWHLLGRGNAAFLTISLLQAIAISSVVFPCGWLARRWFNDDAATVCRWLACGMPLYAWYATRLHHTALVMAFHPWLLYGWLTLPTSPTFRRILWVGLGTGLGGLFQPVLLAVFGPISFIQTVISLARKEWKIAGSVVLAGILTLLVITPWTIRNYQVHGRLILIKDSFGKEFWMGNNPYATGTGYAEGGEVEITNLHPPKAMELRGKASEIELMDALQKEAWEYCKADPAAFIQRTLTKIFWFWTATPTRFERTTGDGEAHKFRMLHIGYWLLFLALTAMAAIRYRPWSREYLSVFIFYVVLFSLIYGITHVGQARFRGELEYIFLPAVACGVIVLWRWIFGPKKSQSIS